MKDLTVTLASAVQFQREGDFPQAEAFYRRILEHHPDLPGALHLLGVLSHQRGRDDIAADLIARAVALDPHQATYHTQIRGHIPR